MQAPSLCNNPRSLTPAIRPFAASHQLEPPACVIAVTVLAGEEGDLSFVGREDRYAELFAIELHVTDVDRHGRAPLVLPDVLEIPPADQGVTMSNQNSNVSSNARSSANFDGSPSIVTLPGASRS